MVTFIAYLWMPKVAIFLTAYYNRSRMRCENVFKDMMYELTPWKKTFFYVIGPIISFAFAIFIFKSIWLKFLIGLTLSILTHDISYRFALHMKRSRILKIKSQLVDSLGLIGNALRSGLSLQQGFQMASEEMPPPISQELSRIVSEQQLGKSFDQCLLEFQKRVPVEEVELLVTSLITLKETGGNIIETIEIITHTIREEQRVLGKIKTITTQGIAQAVVISMLPFVLAAALYIVSPGYIEPMLTHPIGWGMIAFMLLMQATGMYLMKKIVTIKV